jgi:hypothetical protein
VYFKWLLNYLVYQLPLYIAIASKPVGGLVNYAFVYVVCEFVDVIKKYKVDENTEQRIFHVF